MKELSLILSIINLVVLSACLYYIQRLKSRVWPMWKRTWMVSEVAVAIVLIVSILSILNFFGFVSDFWVFKGFVRYILPLPLLLLLIALDRLTEGKRFLHKKNSHEDNIRRMQQLVDDIINNTTAHD